MRKAETEKLMVDSARSLARLVGRSHSAVSEWLKRGDFPFNPCPPWPATLADAIREWGDELSDNRYDNRHRPPAQRWHGPGAYRWNFSDNIDVMNEPKWKAWEWLTNASYYKSAVRKQGEELADVLNDATCEVLSRVAQEKEGHKLLENAPREYYRRMFRYLENDPKGAQKFIDAWDAAFLNWFDAVAKKRKAGLKALKPKRENE
jgi:hypothetical protein